MFLMKLTSIRKTYKMIDREQAANQLTVSLTKLPKLQTSLKVPKLPKLPKLPKTLKSQKIQQPHENIH